MKNEGAFLLDWVAHYKALAFDHLVICTNDCTDPTVAMVERLQALGLARHHPTQVWPRAGIQRSALKQARRYPEVSAAGWVLVCDADEFLVVRDGDRTVRALIEGAGTAEVISVAWRSFGPVGQVAYRDLPVTTQFRMAEADPGPAPMVPTFGKSLFRGDLPLQRIGIHAPVPDPALGRGFHRCFAGGLPYRHMDHELALLPDYGHAQINHYALRSFESFLVKRDRGRANHSAQPMGLDYWRRFDRAEVACDAIRPLDPAVAEWRARLAADGELATLHRQAVDWHRTRAAQLAARPEDRALQLALRAEGRLTG